MKHKKTFKMIVKENLKRRTLEGRFFAAMENHFSLQHTLVKSINK